MDVLACMMAEGARDADIASIAQTECYVFVAWERGGRGTARGKGNKGKNGCRPRYSHGMKPNLSILSLEDRKKALAKLKVRDQVH